MITIVNYGLGNIQAFANIYKRLNIEARIASSAAELDGAERIILPGVGAFDWAMTRLEESGMRERLDYLVLKEKRPVLGICVGMQIIARQSEEGELSGLGWIDAHVKRFNGNLESGGVRLPHMGWNDVTPVGNSGLFKGLETGARFYFLHSYYFPKTEGNNVLAVTDYNGPFASAVHADNVFGVQFHPEKSHGWGIRVLKNFSEL